MTWTAPCYAARLPARQWRKASDALGGCESSSNYGPASMSRSRAAREEMAQWYSEFTFPDLCKHLTAIRVAPGVEEAFASLHRHDFRIAIVSLTWEFAAEWFANKLGTDYFVGQGLSSEGTIAHFWPQDKAQWLTGLAGRLGVEMGDVAAVGDSGGDIPMLLSVGHRFWVGQTIPPQLEGKVVHDPSGDIRLVAQRMIEAQGR